jgi:hypothetical protein
LYPSWADWSTDNTDSARTKGPDNEHDGQPIPVPVWSTARGAAYAAINEPPDRAIELDGDVALITTESS